MFIKGMLVEDMEKALTDLHLTTNESYQNIIDKIEIEALKIYLENYQNEKKIRQIEFSNKDKVGLIAFEIASRYEKLQTNLLFGGESIGI